MFIRTPGISSAKWVLFVALLAWIAVKAAQKIDLTNADAGRHITNGAMILGSAEDRSGVLYTNFYSYTMPGQPFINHHWLTGVLFYLIWKYFGFTGLSIATVLATLIACALFFDVARRASNFWLALVAMLATSPLVTDRFDMRPEVITNLLIGIFLWILWQYRAGKLPPPWLYTLPVLMLLWVNLHIGFVFGFLLLGAFLLDAIVPAPSPVKPLPKPALKKEKAGRKPPRPVPPADQVNATVLPAVSRNWRPLAKVAGLCLAAALLNPHLLQGLLYPLSIFENYGYRIVENASIPTLEGMGFGAVHPFVLYRLVAGALVLSCLVSAIKSWRRLDISLLIPAFVTGVMAWFALRNFAVFGYLVTPALAGIVAAIQGFAPAKKVAAMLAAVVSVWQQGQTFPQYLPTLGLGLLPGAEASGDFFRANHIAGPIFNDYDIGGYLIYKLALQDGRRQPVFVDNRPEAYTAEFFQNVYKPAQLDEVAWQQLDARYHFNAIFFSRRDGTAWAQTFLASRSRDSAWVAVLVDNYNVIFLRRDNPRNAALIQQYGPH